jgi:hypothetical protein
MCVAVSDWLVYEALGSVKSTAVMGTYQKCCVGSVHARVDALVQRWVVRGMLLLVVIVIAAASTVPKCRFSF